MINYESLNEEIKRELKSVARNIETFCVMDNTDYIFEYKEDLRQLYKEIVKIIED